MLMEFGSFGQVRFHGRAWSVCWLCKSRAPNLQPCNARGGLAHPGNLSLQPTAECPRRSRAVWERGPYKSSWILESTRGLGGGRGAYPTQQASRAPRRARRRHPGLRRLQLMRRFSGICLRTPLPGRCPALGQRGASLPREGPATHPGGQRSALPWRVLRICEGCSEFRLLQAAGPGAPSQSRLT